MTPSSSLPNNRSKVQAPFLLPTEKSDFPKLNLRVAFVGSCFLSGAIRLFSMAGCQRAPTIDETDLFVFLGGEDVDPALYGEKPLRGTYFDRSRDDREMKFFETAQQLGIPSFGICRGHQFLHVMNGGKLWQHVGSHGRSHVITDKRTGSTLMASSMHHQMVRPDSSTIVLATATGITDLYQAQTEELCSDRHEDCEAAAWPDINAVGVQGHPELLDNLEYSAYCINLVKDHLAGAFKLPPSTIDPAVVPPSITNEG